MQGLVVFPTPLTQLPYKIQGAQWVSEDNKLTIKVDLFLSVDDLVAGRVLVSRYYYVPLTDNVFAGQVNDLVKAAISAEGTFSTEDLVIPDPPLEPAPEEEVLSEP